MTTSEKPDGGYVQILLSNGHVIDISADMWPLVRAEILGGSELLSVEDRYGADCLIRASAVAGARETSLTIEMAFRDTHPDDESFG